jgi:L-lactate dehydrogenase complex protein LldF
MSERTSIPLAPTDVGRLQGLRPFPEAARTALADAQLRRNIGSATATIRAKRLSVVAEVDDWEELRVAGETIKASTMARLDELLVQFEEQLTARGATVHWARDAREANEIVTRLVLATGTSDVVKVKSMVTQEIGLNGALEQVGVAVFETDLAELIVQLGHDEPSHILVPAIHRNRAQIREIFLAEMAGVDRDISDEPAVLAGEARRYLRRKFLDARVAISGANFGVAETGTLVVVESEGNGRMCLTLPDVLITVMGIEKLVPSWGDLEVFLQLLPRSSTGERMNPYTTMWTGVTPGDGPQEVHVVLLDNGRTATLADDVGRQVLHCIRCSACLNVCPVYERTGGHAYGSTYPGPIGAVLSPQLTGLTGDAVNDSLPYASTLCGACFDACPVRIDIPSVLVHLRAKHTEAAAAHGLPGAEQVAMSALSWVMRDADRYRRALRAGSRTQAVTRRDRFRRLPWPLSRWTAGRDAPAPAPQSFRDWWQASGRP